MSRTAEDVSATVNSKESSLSATDQIADLLIAEDETASGDEKEDENLNLESNLDEDEESDEGEADGEEGDEESDEDETDLEAIADDDLSWEGVIGLPEEQLSFDDKGNLKGIKVKVNDFEGVLTVPELVAGYQTGKAVTMKGQALAEDKKAFEGQKERVEQIYASKLESVDALSAHFEKQLISEFDGVDWNALRNSDPAEYAAARHDYAARAGELKRIQEAIATDKAAAQKEMATANAVKMQSYAKEQHDKMLEKNPEWRDEKVREKARDGFKNFVNETYGFTEQEFDTVFDARLIELIKDAKKYREGSKVAAKKLTKPVPKFQKSRGGQKNKRTSKLEKLTAQAAKAKGGARRDLQASAVAELLMGSK